MLIRTARMRFRTPPNPALFTLKQWVFLEILAQELPSEKRVSRPNGFVKGAILPFWRVASISKALRSLSVKEDRVISVYCPWAWISFCHLKVPGSHVLSWFSFLPKGPNPLAVVCLKIWGALSLSQGLSLAEGGPSL